MAEGSETKPSRRKISAIPSSNSEKKSNPKKRSKISSVDETNEQHFDPNVAKHSLRRSFLITLVIGTVLILSPMKFLPAEGIIKIVASAVLMFIYYLAGMKYVRSANTRAVFADSLYYLGFLFTFIALVGAMTSLNELNIQSIIGQMGPALVTTVIGMAARIYLTQFEPITSEPETEAISSMSNLSAQIITTLKSLEQVQSTSAKQIEAFSQNLNKINVEALQIEFNKLAISVRELANSSHELKNSGDRTKITVDEAQRKFDGLDTSVSNAKQKLDDVEILTSDVKTLNSKIENAATAFSEVGEKLETKVNLSATEAVNSITEAAREAEKAKEEARKLTGTLKKTVTDVADFLNREK